MTRPTEQELCLVSVRKGTKCVDLLPNERKDKTLTLLKKSKLGTVEVNTLVKGVYREGVGREEG